jgi:hypothetical protein
MAGTAEHGFDASIRTETGRTSLGSRKKKAKKVRQVYRYDELLREVGRAAHALRKLVDAGVGGNDPRTNQEKRRVWVALQELAAMNGDHVRYGDEVDPLCMACSVCRGMDDEQGNMLLPCDGKGMITVSKNHLF